MNYFGRKPSNNEQIIMLKDESPSNGNSNDIFHFNSSINFYSDIEDGTINTLINLIREKTFSNQGIQVQFQLAEPPPIHLHIQSYGGIIFSGIAGMETIRNNKVPIYTYVDGMAASAATFLSCVGTKRFINKEACMLIHQLTTGFWGKFNELQDEVINSKLLMEKIRSIYKAYTKLDDKTLNALLKRDLYLDAKDCLKYGLVDEII